MMNNKNYVWTFIIMAVAFRINLLIFISFNNNMCKIKLCS